MILDRHLPCTYNLQKKKFIEPVSLTFHSALRKLNTEPHGYDRNLVGSIYGMSSDLYEDCSFRPDRLANMATHAILVSDWSISKVNRSGRNEQSS
jgi:hypothetical protein